MREDLWQKRIDRVQQCFAAGMSRAETADHLGVTPITIKTYIARANLEPPCSRGVNVEKIMQCAASGMTRQETAVELGMSYPSVAAYAREHTIKFKRAGLAVSDHRSEAMEAMYRAGKTLEEIGSVYSITRERVRQILTKYHGIRAKDGGQAARAKARKQRAEEKRNAKFMARYGCSHADYVAIASRGKEMLAGGSTYYKAPLGAYRSQQRNAKIRGIEWRLSLGEWWDIWQKSGKWTERGRGHGYVMCRFGDAGAYEIGNVYIATGVHNAAVQPNNPYRKDHPQHGSVVHKLRNRGQDGKCFHRVHIGLPKGVTVNRGRFQAQATIAGNRTYLGSFSTPEAAHKAYVEAVSAFVGIAA